jgi:hypothetical protein|tara:strand:+ start:193 stop:348 length:156 start_codon:yes stop_codon:yes gene_type:complete
MKYILIPIIVLLSGCMTTVAVVDTASSAVISTGELVVDTIDLITPDIIDDD